MEHIQARIVQIGSWHPPFCALRSPSKLFEGCAAINIRCMGEYFELKEWDHAIVSSATVVSVLLNSGESP